MERTVEYQRDVMYYETDRMGIVHHANYLHYLEEARLYFLERNGLSYDRLEKLGVLSPVVSLSVDYRKSLTYGDGFLVKTSLSSYGGLRFSFRYEIFDAKSGNLVLTGTSQHCFIDKDGHPLALFRKYPELDKTLRELVLEEEED